MLEIPHPDPVVAGLVARRRRMGVSQVALAARMGTSAPYLSDHERGRLPRLAFLERWIAAIAELEALREQALADHAADADAGARPMRPADLSRALKGAP